MVIVDPQREYTDVAIGVGSFEALATYLDRTRGHWRIAFYNDHLEADFEALTRVVYALGACLFIVEEADRFSPVFRPSAGLQRIIRYGRHAQRGSVDYLCVSRAPAEVARDCTAQAYGIACFTVQEPRHVDYLKHLVGDEYAAGLGELPPLHYRYLNLWDRSAEGILHRNL